MLVVVNRWRRLCCQLISSQNQSASRKVESNDGIGPDALGASFGDISSHLPCRFFFSFEMVNWGWLGLAGGAARGLGGPIIPHFFPPPSGSPPQGQLGDVFVPPMLLEPPGGLGDQPKMFGPRTICRVHLFALVFIQYRVHLFALLTYFLSFSYIIFVHLFHSWQL